MAKKPTTPKKATPTGVEAAPVKSAIPATKPANVAVSKPAKAKKTVATKATSARVKASPVTKTAAGSRVTPADVALRAYFIAEKRQKSGLPGDSTSDWVEAERQLKAEAAAKAKA